MTQLTGVRILLVDDEPDHLELFGEILRHAGAEVIEAADADAGRVLLEGIRPHVVISDIGLPGDGIGLVRRARELAIPAIALTGRGTDQERSEALDRGFAVHLLKPVTPEELCARVAALLRVHRD